MEPLLDLNLFLKLHRATYYDLLQPVRTAGDWEAWLNFFFQGVREIAESAVSTVQRLLAMFTEDRRLIQGAGRIAGQRNRLYSCTKVLQALSEGTEKE